MGTVALNCLVIGEDNPFRHIFMIHIEPTKFISDLRKEIWEDRPQWRNISHDCLELYTPKSTISTASKREFINQFAELNFDTPEGRDSSLIELNPTQTVIGSGLSEPAKKQLHIVVCLPEDASHDIGVLRIKRKRTEPEAVILEKNRLRKIAKRAPPSLSNPSDFQSAARDIVCCNRPFDFETIPITLLQKEFGQFKDDCDLFPSPEAQKLLQELTVVACEWYENKTGRRSAIEEVLGEQADLYLSAQTINDTEYRTDGNSEVNIMPAVIRKCKNESGCALPEAIGYYVQFLIERLSYRVTRFPCILMVDVGSYLGLYGCLWTGERIFVEPLTPLYDLTTHWTDESGRRAIASSLDAFLKTIKRLETHYARVSSTASIPTPGPSLHDRTYPYKTSYEDEKTGQLISFTYRSRIDDKLVFVAEPDDKDLGALCVKFTRRYSKEAHGFLAQHGHAPQLKAVTALPGGWIMVVMEHSKYTQLSEPTLILSERLRCAVTAKVLDIVRKLHEARFVHGDIRSVNILVDHELLESKGDVQIHLIDLDWAGRIGEVVYPMRINRTTVMRPEGVVDGKPIMPEHDIFMVNLLYNSPTILF